MTKSFDAVAWMRRRRVEIDRETEGLSWEERARYIRQSLKGDAVWERLKDRARARSEEVIPARGMPRR